MAADEQRGRNLLDTLLQPDKHLQIASKAAGPILSRKTIGREKDLHGGTPTVAREMHFAPYCRNDNRTNRNRN